MPSNNHIKSAQNKISAAATEIQKAQAFLGEIVQWIDADTKNIVIGTRGQFLRDRGAI